MIELQLGGGVRPVVRQHGIGAPHKRVANLDPFRLFQVDADAAFPTIKSYEHPALVRGESHVRPPRIAGRRLDFYDVGAQVGEHLRGKRAGHKRAELQNAISGQRACRL